MSKRPLQDDEDEDDDDQASVYLEGREEPMTWREFIDDIERSAAEKDCPHDVALFWRERRRDDDQGI